MIQLRGHCSDGGQAPEACERFGSPQLYRSCFDIERSGAVRERMEQCSSRSFERQMVGSSKLVHGS